MLGQLLAMSAADPVKRSPSISIRRWTRRSWGTIHDMIACHADGSHGGDRLGGSAGTLIFVCGTGGPGFCLPNTLFCCTARPRHGGSAADIAIEAGIVKSGAAHRIFPGDQPDPAADRR